MNNLSFVKRIDDLGRIVIPKDIRRKLKIDENENMEISVINDEIILKKHSLLAENNSRIKEIGKVISEITNNDLIISDRDKIIYSSISEYEEKEISCELKDIIINRINIDNKQVKIVDDYELKTNFIYKNIIIDSDSSGIIIIFGDKIIDRDNIILDITSKLLNQ